MNFTKNNKTWKIKLKDFDWSEPFLLDEKFNKKVHFLFHLLYLAGIENYIYKFVLFKISLRTFFAWLHKIYKALKNAL